LGWRQGLVLNFNGAYTACWLDFEKCEKIEFRRAVLRLEAESGVCNWQEPEKNPI